MDSPMPVALHLGNLHTYETVLLALLAFGPFVVLGVVVALMRRRDTERAVGTDAHDGPTRQERDSNEER